MKILKRNDFNDNKLILILYIHIYDDDSTNCQIIVVAFAYHCIYHISLLLPFAIWASTKPL